MERTRKPIAMYVQTIRDVIEENKKMKNLNHKLIPPIPEKV
ncbi:MAG: hypothetical protein CM15mV112_010 [uncultured marine virus]|nr:MAG: hypothetical protein CM15mV112_010 [uncultured marine virus]